MAAQTAALENCHLTPKTKPFKPVFLSTHKARFTSLKTDGLPGFLGTQVPGFHSLLRTIKQPPLYHHIMDGSCVCVCVCVCVCMYVVPLWGTFCAAQSRSPTPRRLTPQALNRWPHFPPPPLWCKLRRGEKEHCNGPTHRVERLLINEYD